jgi:hypothetical protein
MSHHDGIVYVKQQGAMRTGTNLVKYALEENFTNVRVLVNIGRWKHAGADIPFNWHGLDWEGEGRSVEVFSRISRDELSAARAAIEAGTVKFAISVRGVYSWLVSYLRFICENNYEPVVPLADLPGERIVAALAEWNALYRSYLPHMADEPRAMVFRLEDLLNHFSATLDSVQHLWGLQPRHRHYVKPTRYLRAGIDGQSRSELLHPSLPFDRRQYLPGAHLTQFDDPLLALVRQSVDKEVVRAYGYDLL